MQLVEFCGQANKLSASKFVQEKSRQKGAGTTKMYSSKCRYQVGEREREKKRGRGEGYSSGILRANIQIESEHIYSENAN